MPRLTPAAIAHLSRNGYALPDARTLAVRVGDGAADLDWKAQEVYDAVPDLLETVRAQAEEFHLLCSAVEPERARHRAEMADHEREIRLALRLPADAPFDAVLARARRWAELYDEDDDATVDEVAGG